MANPKDTLEGLRAAAMQPDNPQAAWAEHQRRQAAATAATVRPGLNAQAAVGDLANTEADASRLRPQPTTPPVAQAAPAAPAAPKPSLVERAKGAMTLKNAAGAAKGLGTGALVTAQDAVIPNSSAGLAGAAGTAAMFVPPVAAGLSVANAVQGVANQANPNEWWRGKNTAEATDMTLAGTPQHAQAVDSALSERERWYPGRDATAEQKATADALRGGSAPAAPAAPTLRAAGLPNRDKDPASLRTSALGYGQDAQYREYLGAAQNSMQKDLGVDPGNIGDEGVSLRTALQGTRPGDSAMLTDKGIVASKSKSGGLQLSGSADTFDYATRNDPGARKAAGLDQAVGAKGGEADIMQMWQRNMDKLENGTPGERYKAQQTLAAMTPAMQLAAANQKTGLTAKDLLNLQMDQQKEKRLSDKDAREGSRDQMKDLREAIDRKSTGPDGKLDPVKRDFMTRYALSQAPKGGWEGVNVDEFLRSIDTSASVEQKLRAQSDFMLVPDAWEGKPLGEEPTKFRPDDSRSLRDLITPSMWWGQRYKDDASGRRFTKPSNLTPEQEADWNSRITLRG